MTHWLSQWHWATSKICRCNWQILSGLVTQNVFSIFWKILLIRISHYLGLCIRNTKHKKTLLFISYCWIHIFWKYHVYHRLENRCGLRQISSMNFRFGQSGLQRKKNPSYHKYATFEAIFLMFSLWQNSLIFFKNIP